MSNVFISSEIDVQKVTFTQPIQKKGYHQSILNYENKHGLLVQTPTLVVDAQIGNDSTVELVLEKVKRNNDFYSMVRTMEYLAMSTMSSKSKEWFGKEIGKDKIKSMFRSCLDNPQTLQGNFSLKFRKDRGMKVFNESKEIIEIEDVELLSGVKCILKIQGILFGKNVAKLDIRAQKIAVVKKPPPPKPPTPETVEQSVEDSEGKDGEGQGQVQEEESDYDSDMELDFSPIGGEVKSEVVLNEKVQTNQSQKVEKKQDSETQAQPEIKEVQLEVKKEDPVEDVVENDRNNRMKNLVAEMEKNMKLGDFGRIQEISQELNQLKLMSGVKV